MKELGRARTVVAHSQNRSRCRAANGNTISSYKVAFLRPHRGRHYQPNKQQFHDITTLTSSKSPTNLNLLHPLNSLFLPLYKYSFIHHSLLSLIYILLCHYTLYVQTFHLGVIIWPFILKGNNTSCMLNERKPQKLLSTMGIPIRGGIMRKQNETMRLIIAAFAGVVLGFCLGVSFPTLTLIRMNLPSSLLPSIDLTYVDNNYSKFPTKSLWDAWASVRNDRSMYNKLHNLNDTKIWVPTNPRGAERLPPKIVESESDFYLHRLWGMPHQDLSIRPKYLISFTVGLDQKYNIDAAIKKFSENFTIVLFHYDGHASDWEEFEWSKRAIHISAIKQTKWWYAKRFLHPDIVAAYDYIFIWDEDLGLEHFDAEEYLKMVRKHGLEISQPGVDPSSSYTWQMTRKRDGCEVHKEAEERSGWCSDQHLPPCAAFVEIMAPVFSRDAWRCVWHMIQNDLVHGWGLDFVLKRCVEPPHEKIGVVDTQWVVHQSVPSLGNQGEAEWGRAPWEGVRERCNKEWTIFQERMADAEMDYFKKRKTIPLNKTGQ